MNILRIRKNLGPYFLLSPSGLIVILVMIYPFFYSLFVSLTDQNFGRDIFNFVGLANYIRLFRTDPVFIRSLLLTLYFVFASVFFEFVFGMIIALVLNRRGILVGFIRALLVVPWAIPGTIVSGIWRFLYLRDYGFFNQFFRLLGFSGDVQWIGAKLAMPSVIIAEVWRMTPLVALLLLAGLTNIPQEIYDAASADGANAWHTFWRITLPMLKPVIAIVFVIRIIFSFQNIEMVYVLTRGGPGTATYLLPYEMYKVMFVNLKAGYGSSIAYTTTFLVGSICLIYLLLNRERKHT